MKIWIKYLLGIILGLAAAFILPVTSPQVSSAVNFITELFIRFISYILIPLIFSSVIISVYRLTESKMLLKTSIWSLIVIIGSSLMLTFLGLFSGLVIKPNRIPISVEKLSSVASLNIFDIIRQVFPYSPITSLTDTFFFLPAFVFALTLGLACSYDRVSSRPFVTLTDSLSKICYTVMNFFMDLLSIGMIAITISWMIQFRSVISEGIYTPLILILLGNLAFVSIIVYPSILYFFCHDPHPYRVLYASIAPLITSFLTGNTNVTFPIIARHCKDSLGVQRRANAFATPLFSIFARGGSSLVTIICFILIWRSYSSLNITFSDLIWFTTVSFSLSFILGNMPTGGAFFALTVLCTMYSRGFETGYLLLRPAAAIICSFAAAFDAVTGMFGTYIIAIVTKQIHHKEMGNFI